MAEDFKVKIEADLDTAQADEKIEKLINKKRTIKLDITSTDKILKASQIIYKKV